MTFTPTVLLVSSDASLIDAVGGLVSSVESLRLEVVANVTQACDMAGRADVLMVIAHLDEVGSAADVTRLLQTVAIANPRAVTMVVSDEYHASQALAMLKLGAADYLARPLDLGRLGYLVDVLTLRARRIAMADGAEPAASRPTGAVELLEDGSSFCYLPSTPMGRIMAQIQRIAPQDTTVLLSGETGTGKTRLAGMIHRLSPRKNKPFITINCGALSATLIESEMFGHVKGAFTGADANRVGKFAEAGRGTLFLDEVDSLPISLQAKLLRAVEERVFEPVGSNKSQPMQARIIAACNRPLEPEIAAGRFRPDLYYRLNVISFTVPPVREVRAVVPHLARRFMAEFAKKTGLPVHEISPEAMGAIEVHDWPGNIRELRNTMARAVALCPGHVIHVEDLPDQLQALAPARSTPDILPMSAPGSLAASKEDAERARIAEALERNSNNRLRAAAELGISRMTLYNKMRKYGSLLGT
jgi:DNA-binding NtrC family response regulator